MSDEQKRCPDHDHCAFCVIDGGNLRAELTRVTRERDAVMRRGAEMNDACVDALTKLTGHIELLEATLRELLYNPTPAARMNAYLALGEEP